MHSFSLSPTFIIGNEDLKYDFTSVAGPTIVFLAHLRKVSVTTVAARDIYHPEGDPDLLFEYCSLLRIRRFLCWLDVSSRQPPLSSDVS